MGGTAADTGWHVDQTPWAQVLALHLPANSLYLPGNPTSQVHQVPPAQGGMPPPGQRMPPLNAQKACAAPAPAPARQPAPGPGAPEGEPGSCIVSAALLSAREALPQDPGLNPTPKLCPPRHTQGSRDPPSLTHPQPRPRRSHSE